MTVGYTRLSLDKWDDQLGVTRQREDIIALARSLDWPSVTDFYEDNDASANVDKRAPRPEFDRLLRDMRAGMVTHVLCYDQDRLVRDMRQLEDVVDAVEAGHVKLTSVNGDIDLRSDNGRMVARIKAAVARNEIEKLSRRVKRQAVQRAQNGIKAGSVHRTYGYTRGFTVVPEEAAVLVELFRRKAAGEGVPALVQWLNRSEVKSTTGLVGSWDHARVDRILRRREYIGDVTLNGVVMGPAAFESIIDRAIFEKANDSLPARPEAWRMREEEGLLTGLLVCAICHTRMHRGRGRTTEGRYNCRGCYRTGNGSSLSIAADSAVVEAVRTKEQLVADRSWRSKQANAIEHEIEQARRLHKGGTLTRAELDSVLKHLNGRLLQERRVPGPVRSAHNDEWSTWPLDARREWLATFVDQIVVAAAGKPPRSPVVGLARIDVHFKDGEIVNLARPIVTQDDVAHHVGYCRRTVNRALSGDDTEMTADTYERICEAAKQLGYVVGWYRRHRDG